TKPRIVPKFYASLVGVTRHTPLASTTAVPTLDSKVSSLLLPSEFALLLRP
ncbi:hypothetical protein A2U01_0107594, partial [Trifolium medium]|nr:hypothetical protein [Trifolium medium]